MQPENTISNQLAATSTYGSVDELAQDLGLSRASVYTGLKNGSIPSIRVGRRFVLQKSAIRDWLQAAGRSR